MSGVSLVTGGMVVPPQTTPTASEIADAVWDEDLTTHTTPDSAGWVTKLIKFCGW